MTIKLIFVVYILAAILCVTGEVLCIIKMVRCNWDPIGKAECIYTIGTFTGAGVVIGYLNIQDK
jgi:hypothetical protein